MGCSIGGARGRTRTGTAAKPRDFKSLASTSFATRAGLQDSVNKDVSRSSSTAWAVLAGGGLEDWVVFGGLGLYAVAGCWAQDARAQRSAAVGTVFAKGDLRPFYESTSFAPFVAIADGRQSLADAASEISPVALAAGEVEAGAWKEQMADILDQIAEQVGQHRITLVFVNTRRMAERLAHELAERLGEGGVAAHGRVPSPGHSGGWFYHCHILEHAARGMGAFLDLRYPTE